MKLTALDSILIQIAGVDPETEFENIVCERLKSINVRLSSVYVDCGTETVVKSDLGDLAVVRATFEKNIATLFEFSVTTQPLMDFETLPWNRE